MNDKYIEQGFHGDVKSFLTEMMDKDYGAMIQEEDIKEIVFALKVVKTVREKKIWCSPWIDTMTENGRIYQFCREALEFEGEIPEEKKLLRPREKPYLEDLSEEENANSR